MSNARRLKDIEVLLVSFGPKQVTVKEMERRNLPFTVLYDVNYETYMRYCISGTPTFVLTKNRTMTYIGSDWGSGQGDELLQVIADSFHPGGR